METLEADDTGAFAAEHGSALDEPTQTTRELDCALNDTEVRERGEAMSKAEREIDRLKQRRRNLNAQIRGLSDRMTELSLAIEDRQEQRDVPCVWSPDYKRRTWTLTRQDLGVSIEQRAMTPADLQTRLPLDAVGTRTAPANTNAAAAPTADEYAPDDSADNLLAFDPPPRGRPTKPAKAKAKRGR